MRWFEGMMRIILPAAFLPGPLTMLWRVVPEHLASPNAATWAGTVTGAVGTVACVAWCIIMNTPSARRRWQRRREAAADS